MSKKATIISNCSRNSRSSRTFGSLILLAALLLTACQSDTEDVPVDSRPRSTVELLSYSTPFLEITPWVTRAHPPFHVLTAYQTHHLPIAYLSY